MTPAEFLTLLRHAADKDGAGVVAPQQPSYLDEACTKTMASRAVQRLLLTETVSVARVSKGLAREIKPLLTRGLLIRRK